MNEDIHWEDDGDYELYKQAVIDGLAQGTATEGPLRPWKTPHDNQDERD